MQDRELLELAARASIAEGFRRGQYKSADEASSDLCKDGRAFNPLQDDGDALRLAVKLRITPRVHLQGYSVAVTAQSIVDSYTEICGDDEMAATRRAIVRAAAEIGKNS